MDIAEQLRDTLAKSALTAYSLGKSAGVDPGQISRFISGERDLTLSTAAKLAAVLGMELRPVGRISKQKPHKRRGK